MTKQRYCWVVFIACRIPQRYFRVLSEKPQETRKKREYELILYTIISYREKLTKIDWIEIDREVLSIKLKKGENPN